MDVELLVDLIFRMQDNFQLNLRRYKAGQIDFVTKRGRRLAAVNYHSGYFYVDADRVEGDTEGWEYKENKKWLTMYIRDVSDMNSATVMVGRAQSFSGDK